MPSALHSWSASSPTGFPHYHRGSAGTFASVELGTRDQVRSVRMHSAAVERRSSTNLSGADTAECCTEVENAAEWAGTAAARVGIAVVAGLGRLVGSVGEPGRRKLVAAAAATENIFRFLLPNSNLISGILKFILNRTNEKKTITVTGCWLDEEDCGCC